MALVSTLSTRIRPRGGGSVESIVRGLAQGLTGSGHEVTVFAAGGSEVAGELKAVLPGPYGSEGTPVDWQLAEWMNLCRAVEESERFDVIHSHPYLWGIPLEAISAAPMIHTLHIMPDEDFATAWRSRPNAVVTALSSHQWSAYPDLEPAAVVHHGVDADDFPFVSRPQEYICYLGRFTPDKNPLAAIQAARSCGVPLRLAGSANAYYHSHVAAFVNDSDIHYEGPVSGTRRSDLLGHARVLLYPLRKPEPFGLVLIEAMMCGTPVVALRGGAVEEMVEDGVTGVTVENERELPAAIHRASSLDRKVIRDTAVSKYSSDRMVQDYLHVYERALR